MGVTNFRRNPDRTSNRMYCIRAQVQLMGEDVPRTRYVRFRPHGMDRGYSIWTEDPKAARFWLYRSHPDAWVHMRNPHLNAEVVCLYRDDEVIRAQKEL